MATNRRWVVAAVMAVVWAGPVAAQHEHGEHKMGDEKGMMATPWKEMNGFHKLLHESHHPAMKDGDLTVARRNAAPLAAAADAWAASTPPAACNAPATVGDQLKTLTEEVRKYANLVGANGSDAEVKAGLDKVHDQFEGLHMACMPKGKKHGGEPHGSPSGH